MEVSFPHPGVQTWRNKHGIDILRLHYLADPEKTLEWAAEQKASMTNPADYEQEFEINFAAKLGTLIYQLHDEATLEHSFPIPANWTRYFALDPHPVVPHASLWVALDPWGDAWVYRELWPSKISGQVGNAPDDDNRFSIKSYVETIQFLESAENPENEGHAEEIYARVIDYAARAMGQGFFDDRPEYNFQDRFEEIGGWKFRDCVKDLNAGYESVNEWLKPRDLEQADGTFKPKSRLHIFQDRCPELILELKSNRFQQMTPTLADRQDPTGKPMAKRNHLTDCLRYLAMHGLEFIVPKRVPSTWKPVAPGINY